MDRIDNLAERRLADDQVDSWYRVAWDQWQLMELKRDLCRAAAPTSTACPPFPAQRFRMLPATESLPAAPPVCPLIHPVLPPGVPMDVDASHQCLEVRFLAPEEQEELLLQLLAAQDSTGIPSPDATTSDDREEEAPSNPAKVEASEEDF
ncbi:hypothetical protein C0992_007440 [Termitomyces sp. T32_za158]|nr:hypothetical protein C0992_007440 [Termitomyces sp. T32_za158]